MHAQSDDGVPLGNSDGGSAKMLIDSPGLATTDAGVVLFDDIKVCRCTHVPLTA